MKEKNEGAVHWPQQAVSCCVPQKREREREREKEALRTRRTVTKLHSNGPKLDD